MAEGTEVRLNEPPQDGVSSVKFSKQQGSPFLLVSSWDQTVRLYHAQQNATRNVFRLNGAVLDCAFQDDSKAFAGGLDCVVRMLDLHRDPQDGQTPIGHHEKEVKCVEYSQRIGAAVTGGWDGAVHLWDPRRAKGPVASLPASEKVYTLDVREYKLVVGTSDRSVLIYDARNVAVPQDRRESSLKHQTRCIRISPDCRGYVLTSVEGRVAVEYFDNSPEVQAKRYAFKCHRVQERVYPVNCVAFHPIHGTFATGGADGSVYTWDGENKKRVAQYTGYPTSIAAMDFNYDGSLLAIAASYTFEEGEKSHVPDEVYLRTPAEAEVRRKQR